MATLYELTDDYARLIAQLEMAENEEEAGWIWAELDALEGSITDKAEAYARILRNKAAEAEMYKAEKQRLEKRQKAAENVAEGLKARLLDNMMRLNVTAIQTGIGKWRVQANPPSCEVLVPEDVPADYHIPQPDKIDRAAILKHYKATGELLPGVEIRQSQGLRFR